MNTSSDNYNATNQASYSYRSAKIIAAAILISGGAIAASINDKGDSSIGIIIAIYGFCMLISCIKLPKKSLTNQPLNWGKQGHQNEHNS